MVQLLESDLLKEQEKFKTKLSSLDKTFWAKMFSLLGIPLSNIALCRCWDYKDVINQGIPGLSGQGCY